MESRRQIRDLTTRNNRIRDENEMLNSECSSLNAKLSQLEASSSSELATLRNRLSEVESDRDGLKGWQRRAESLAIEIEELKRRSGSRGQDEKPGTEDDKALRKELKGGLSLCHLMVISPFGYLSMRVADAGSRAKGEIIPLFYISGSSSGRTDYTSKREEGMGRQS